GEGSRAGGPVLCARRPMRRQRHRGGHAMMTVTGSGSFRPDSALYRSPTHFLRGSLGRFATGVAVVTFDAAEDDGSLRRQGITVNSFTSVSMEPPLVLVSIQ